MATPFPFGSGNVLTAAQMNAITTLPVSTKTGSYTLTVADVGYRIVMNSASPTTITVNTSIFGASDVVEILNIGAGVCTVTAGTCTVSTSGTLALAQNAGGTLTFISASASVFVASGVAASAGGLVRIGSTSLSGSSTNIPSVFSTTYKNYRVVVDNAVASARGEMRFRIGANVSTGIYYSSGLARISSGTTANNNTSAATQIAFGNWETTIKSVGVTIELQNPFEALTTNLQAIFGGGSITDLWSGFVGAVINDTTSYTGFTLLTEGGTFSSGTVTVYGYANS